MPAVLRKHATCRSAADIALPTPLRTPPLASPPTTPTCAQDSGPHRDTLKEFVQDVKDSLHLGGKKNKEQEDK